MTHDQVVLLLSTPLLRGPLHVSRWNYTFSTSRNSVIREQVDLTLYFEDGLFVRAKGNAVQKAVGAVQAKQKSASGGQTTAPPKRTGHKENT